MSTLGKLAQKILTILADGKFHSGNDLANDTSKSRTAIWKQINQIKACGYHVNTVASRGYQLLEPLDPLISTTLTEKVQEQFKSKNLQIRVLHATNSTNDYLKTPEFKHLKNVICVAEQQLNGRGRFNRYWHSPFGQNIYLSLKASIFTPINQLSGFTLSISLALISAFKNLGLDEGLFEIKWPNDIMLKGKKLAGILVELSGEIGGEVELIIGIGINVNMSQAEIEKSWTSLKREFGRHFDRIKVILAVINSVIAAINKFERHGFETFFDDWIAKDFLFGQKLELSFSEHKVIGFCRGIDKTGNLLIEKEGGVLQAYSAGEVSLHKES